MSINLVLSQSKVANHLRKTIILYLITPASSHFPNHGCYLYKISFESVIGENFYKNQRERKGSG